MKTTNYGRTVHLFTVEEGLTKNEAIKLYNDFIRHTRQSGRKTDDLSYLNTLSENEKYAIRTIQDVGHKYQAIRHYVYNRKLQKHELLKSFWSSSVIIW